MIKKGTGYLTLLVLLISMCFNADAGFLKPGRDNKTAKKNLGKKAAPSQITAFKIPGQIAPELIVNDPIGNYIALVMHAGTPVTNLTPTITVTSGSTVTPNSGVAQDFTAAVGYTVDGINYYSVNVFLAVTHAPICSETSTTIPGHTPTPAGTFSWEILDPATNTWSPAPGPNSITGTDYVTPALASNPTTPKLYTFRRSIIVAGVGTTWDSYTDLTVIPTISGNTINQPVNSVFCASGDPGIITGSLPTGGDGNYVYQWQSSVAGGPFTSIPNTNVKDYSPGNLTLTTSYIRTVFSGACTTPLPSTPVTITIQPSLGNNTIATSGTTTFCASGAPGIITGSVPTGGDGTNYTYQWQSSTAGGPFTPIPNTNVKDYSPGILNATTSYIRTVFSGTCTTPVASTPVTITIQPTLANNTIATSGITTFCATGDPGIITGSLPTGGDGTTYTYQWQSSTAGSPFTPISNTNVKDYNPGILTLTTSFRRIVSSGACIGTAVSTPVTITVYQAVTNTIKLPIPSAFCETGEAGTIMGVTPTNGDGTYNYSWEQSTDNTNFTKINGQTGPNLNFPVLHLTTYYRRLVTSGICTTPVISNVVEIHITPPITFSSIQSPPFSYCVSVDPETLTGGFPQGGDGGNSYQYQWFSSTDFGASWNPISSMGTSIDYDPPTITKTTWFRRDATSGACQIPFPSNIAKIIVNQTPGNVSVNSVAPLCAGGTVKISVISPDPTLFYIWYDNQTKNNPLHSGIDFTTGPLISSQTFYVEASNGTCPSPVLTSVPVTVNSLPAAPTLITNPVSTCAGSQAELDISNPQSGIAYNWYTSATGGTPVFTNAHFSTPPVTGNITYYAEAVNSTNCASSTRTAVPVSAVPLPTVVAHGASVCPGGTATLTTDNADIEVTINWYKTATGGIPVHTGNDFPVPSVNTNTTYYAEAVNGNCISVKRSKAQATVVQPLPAPVVSVEKAVAPEITFSWTTVSGATGYEISLDNGLTFSTPSSGNNGTTHTVKGLEIGQSVTIIVHATGDFSCQLGANSASVTGTAANPLIDEIFVANAFTPNNDGKNDVIYVHNENIKSLKFYVYDQWGELLYYSQSQQNGWDGTFKGRKEPAGVYVYYLETIMNDGKLVKKKGTITLLR